MPRFIRETVRNRLLETFEVFVRETRVLKGHSD
jgi:hypothetical protein